MEIETWRVFGNASEHSTCNKKTLYPLYSLNSIHFDDDTWYWKKIFYGKVVADVSQKKKKKSQTDQDYNDFDRT